MISQLICHTEFGLFIRFESIKSGNETWMLGGQQVKVVISGREMFIN